MDQNEEDVFKHGNLEERLECLANLIMKIRKSFLPSTAHVIAEFATPIHLPMLSLRCDLFNTTDNVQAAYIQIKPDMLQMMKLNQDPLHILLLIDVSGSMSTPVTTADKEEDGFTILDIVKHAAGTIIESLATDHHVTLISFSTNARMILRNVPMSTSENKKTAHDAIKSLRPQGATNLWDGMMVALSLIKDLADEEDAQDPNTRSEILIFTDGMPNRNPSRGIIEEFRYHVRKHSITLDMFSIRTFGFGYSLDSELLEQIAKYGRGTFNFIPDASFVGTVFIHTIADILSGVPVKEVELYLEGVKGYHQVDSVEDQNPDGKNYIMGIKAPMVTISRKKSTILRIPLGNVGSGQIKDIMIKRPDFKRIYVFYYDCRTGIKMKMAAVPMQSGKSTLEESTVAACELRTSFCDLLSSILKSGKTNRDSYQTYTKISNFSMQAIKVQSFIGSWGKNLQAGFKELETMDDIVLQESDESDGELSLEDFEDEVEEDDGKKNDDDAKAKPNKMVKVNKNTRALLIQQGILDDLKGQVSEAVSREEWFKRWGIYYLRSLRFAHQRQYKNNFKDEGIKNYGGVAFVNEVERVNKVFDSLPPPEPSAYRRSHRWGGSSSSNVAKKKTVNMSAYNNSSGPCFGPDTLVLLSDGQHEKLVPCSELRKGDMIVTGSMGEIGRIRCVIETVASDFIPVIHFEKFNFTVTPWHPVNVMGIWSFPAEIATRNEIAEVRMVSRVFNFILEEETADHTILLDGRYPSVLLGHGKTDDAGVLNHEYFANYAKVVEDLSEMNGWSEGYIKLDVMSCIERDAKTGRVARLVGPLYVE